MKILKTCTKCGETKEISLFHKHPRGKYGVASICKICANSYQAAYQNERYVNKERKNKVSWKDIKEMITREKYPKGFRYDHS